MTKQKNGGNSIENLTYITLWSIKNLMQNSVDPSGKPKKSIQQFTSDINPYSNPNKTWVNIKRLCGLYPQKHIHCLNNLTPTIDPQEIANSFGQTWSE